MYNEFMLESLIAALWISFGIQFIFFSIAFLYRTDKVTDLSYGLTFIILAIIFLIMSSFGINQIILTLLILFWGLRISGYLFRRILKTGKDSRFDKIRHDFLKFGGFWLFQAFAVWIIMLPALIVLNSKQQTNFNIFSLLGIGIWLLGFIIESFADQQKYNFKSKSDNKDKWIDKGLWKFSRHPNYFGEILCWVGIFIFSIPYLSNLYWFSIISPLFIAFILIFVSGIPPLEKRYDEKYKDNKSYKEYKRKTSLLVPLPN